MCKFPLTLLLTLLALAAVGSQVSAQDVPLAPKLAPASPPSNTDPRFERGQPHKFVDAVGWVFGVPSKIILWDRRAVNHSVSAKTEESVVQYLDAQGIATTKVRINEYDPLGEWQRLAANRRVGAGWRYTFGALGAVGYTLFPGRLFGADGYNPYTDSIYIYSDIPCLAEEQASYAKLVQGHAYPGTYVAVASLPFVRLWPMKQAKDDVLDYTLARGTSADEREAIHVLYAEYGAEIGGQLAVFAPVEYPITLAGAGLGHVAAHVDAAAVPQQTSSPSVAALPAAPPSEVVPATFNK
jgi:hypothetical protein